MADPDLVIGGAMGGLWVGAPSRRCEGGWGGAGPPNFFSLDMLLETHLGVNNYTKFTQIGDNVG